MYFMGILWGLYFYFSIKYYGLLKRCVEEKIGSGGKNRTCDLQVMSLSGLSIKVKKSRTLCVHYLDFLPFIVYY